jgi:hypothetical protein
MKDYQVFVYCSGKCGSTTLYKTLGEKFKTIHIHSNDDYIKNYPDNKNTIFDLIDYSKTTHETIYIIDAYRTPIERKISSFFHHIENKLPNFRDMNLTDLISWFNDNLLYKIENYHSINEIMNYYEIPLFQKFNFNRGYNMVKKDNIVFIKLLFKDIERWPSILTEIFKTNIPKLKNANLTENKHTAAKYNEFKQIYKTKRDYLQHLQTKDPEFIIYNTPQDINEYIQKWSKNSM